MTVACNAESGRWETRPEPGKDPRGGPGATQDEPKAKKGNTPVASDADKSKLQKLRMWT